MATHHGKDGLVWADSNFIAEITEFTLTETAETADDTAKGDAANTHLVGQVGWNATVKGHYDPDDAGQVSLTVGAVMAGVRFYPEGANSGDTYETGAATVTGVSRQATLRGVVEVDFTLSGQGALTLTTV